VANFTVVYDACVLYSAAVRDLAIELARTGLLRAKWTARIHTEWINATIRNRPELDRARLERASQLMDAAVLDCLVTGFEPLEAGLTSLPDPDDRHVLAAAIHCGAQEIVTFNLRDFPEAALHPYGIKAIHPDTFVEHLLDLNSEAVCEAVRRIRRRLANPPRTAQEMIENYERHGLAVSASILRSRANSL
jgi:predicted nucleic acid-binding protein